MLTRLCMWRSAYTCCATWNQNTELGASFSRLVGLGKVGPTTCGQLSSTDTSMLTSGLKTHSKVSFMMRKESNKNQVPSDLIVDNESTAGHTLQTQVSVGRKRGVHEAQTDNKHAGRQLYQPQQLPRQVVSQVVAGERLQEPQAMCTSVLSK